jgi:murein DD-endopeptidase MepM/ murein hydrolase activator NlpD
MTKETSLGNGIKWFARIAATAICLFLVASVIAVFTNIPDAKAITQSEVDKLKNQLSSITAQRKELEKELKNLDKQQATMTQQIEALDNKIAAAEEEIELQLQLITALENLVSIKETELSESEAKMDAQYELMRDRVRFMAEHGNVSYLSILLSSESFSDFLTRFEVIKSIVEHDNSIFDAFRATCDDVASQKASLEESYAEAEAQEKLLEDNKAKMEAEVAQREAKMAELVKTESETRKEYNSIAAEEDKLVDDVRDAVNELAKQSSSVYVGGKFQWPLPAKNNIVTCVYGMRVHPITGVYKLHTGVDLRATSGTNIYAANSGTVITSTYSTAYGNYVVIDHGGGVATLYAHMTKRLVKVGEKVKQGKVIGYVGSTGYSTGPHLHFEIIKNGDYVDPVKEYAGFRIVHKDGRVLSK